MALRNPIRRPARFLLSVVLLAIAGMTFVAGLSARDGMVAVAEQSSDQLGWDVMVQLAGMVSADSLTDVVEQAPGIERWRAGPSPRPASPRSARSRSPIPIPTRGTAASK